MMKSTHALVGGTTGFVISTAVAPSLDAPSYLDAAVIASAVMCATASSSLPDSLEKLIRAKHRTVTHWPSLQLTIIGVLTLGLSLASGLPIALVALGVTGPIALGCVMHSVADAMTIDPKGIQLLWPISRRGYHLTPRWARVRVATDSRSEWVFGVVWCLLVLTYTYARFRHSIPA